jgi:hypothetical protein
MLSVFFIIGCASTDGQEKRTPSPPQVLKGLGNRLKIRLEADSWPELCEKAKPTFTWNGKDMMWIIEEADGKTIFKMNRAFIFEPTGERPRWILLYEQNGEHDNWYRELSGQSLEGIAHLNKGKPVHDSGAGHYAIIFAQNDNRGIMYEVGWQDQMGEGTNRSQGERRLYVLKEITGKWFFMGEGPSECSAKGLNFREYFSSSFRANVIWKPDRNPPCKINFQVRFNDFDNNKGGKHEKNIYNDCVLDGTTEYTKKLCEREYYICEENENLQSIIAIMAPWESEWDNNRTGERDKILEMWRTYLINLNPGVDFTSIKSGTRLNLPTHREIYEYLHPKSPK